MSTTARAREDRAPAERGATRSRKTRWLVAVLAALGTLLATLLVMNLWTGGSPARHPLVAPYDVRDEQFLRTASTLFSTPLVGGNRVETLLNGASLEAMLDAIRSAEKSVTFETYIFWSGDVGGRFIDAFVDRARAGVPVHVLLDWVGTDLSEDEVEKMRSAGVELHFYNPLAWYSLDELNNRTHRKILVVDGAAGFIGGVGVADHWRGNAESPDHWRDTHFRVAGPVVAQLQAAFLDNWLELRLPLLHGEAYFPELESRGGALAQVIETSSDEASENLRLAYLLSIASAKKSILIGNAYFVPERLLLDALVEAEARGVEVQIIVPGELTDVDLTRQASRASWGELLEAGAAIYEYQPTMYHTKIMIVDDVWVLVGSANFDNRSFRLNDEANLNVWDPEFALGETEQFHRDRARSRRVTLDEWKRRPLKEKVLDYLASWLGPQL